MLVSFSLDVMDNIKSHFIQQCVFNRCYSDFFFTVFPFRIFLVATIYNEPYTHGRSHFRCTIVCFVYKRICMCQYELCGHICETNMRRWTICDTTQKTVDQIPWQWMTNSWLSVHIRFIYFFFSFICNENVNDCTYTIQHALALHTHTYSLIEILTHQAAQPYSSNSKQRNV